MNLDARFDRYLDPPDCPEGYDCQVCGREMITSETFYNSLGQEVCDYCEIDNLTVCANCGETFNADNAIKIDGKIYCQCMKEEVV